MIVMMGFLFYAFSFGSNSWAQTTEEEMIEKGRQAYKYGEQLFNEGNYPEAIKAFLRAYEMTQRYQLLFNLALSYQFSADLQQARFYFEEYQRLAPAEEWNEAQLRIDNIDKILKENESKKQEAEQKNTSPVLVAPSKRPAWLVPTLWSVGSISMGAGLYFGISSQLSTDSIPQYCLEGICRSEAGELLSASRTNAIFADISWGIGLVSLGGALYLQLFQDKSLSISTHSIQFQGRF